MSVHTYADGFGVWHAVVPEHAYADPSGAARRAIRRELAERSGPSFDPRVIGVQLHDVTDGRMTYRETSARGVLVEPARTSCAYFATCDRPADGTVSNPVLGTVPCCTRCAETVGATLIPTNLEV